MNLHQCLKCFFDTPPLSGEIASLAIREELLRPGPSMIGRFGSVEIKGVLYPRIPFPFGYFIKGKIFSAMGNNAGFFPVSDESVSKFSELMLRDMRQLDVLGSWRLEERFFVNHFSQARRVELNALEPYLSVNPWSELLESKKVLVVHPFNKSIERQYCENRKFLFMNQRVLPEFKSLQTIKAVQTIAGEKREFDNWFEALDEMKSAIDKADFDVAIIGCGAYGFPLAAHVKRKGKKSVHLGGATQILFGIKGRRWDRHPKIGPLYNEYWIRPSPDDVPKNATKVEGGCYW